MYYGKNKIASSKQNKKKWQENNNNKKKILRIKNKKLKPVGRENSAIQIFQTFFFLFSFQVGESTFLSFIDFFGCTESFKKKKYL